MFPELANLGPGGSWIHLARIKSGSLEIGVEGKAIRGARIILGETKARREGYDVADLDFRGTHVAVELDQRK